MKLSEITNMIDKTVTLRKKRIYVIE